ncbi:hypothetical protein F4553_006772 [Allocatelliglobosispora scoriae]|uniref:Uncharacterized protein n=1 Tax=Allocatelliglobosispora scoriae TaxID=643052 RepID=A0A841C0R9_9ACTN|nr:hypothetical protein [Allocatelliglobosispora scoriae]MBB5873338.1 hypothetical protein [Allocatelliglobosispora scoriae]
MSLPFELCDRTLNRIVARHGDLVEVETPLAKLVSPMSPEPVGSMRVFRGTSVAKLVYVGLVVPMIHLDSHMIFAFTGPESAVPHFTLDSVYGGSYHAFHLDLIPRADLATHLSYVDAAYHPLTPVFEAASAQEGLTAAAVGPRQRAVMSPWMLVNRATEEAFAGIGEHVDAYADHWSSLVEGGFDADVTATLADTDLPGRDAAVRANIFSRDVDPVWSQVSRLLGDATTDALRAELIANE